MPAVNRVVSLSSGRYTVVINRTTSNGVDGFESFFDKYVGGNDQTLTTRFYPVNGDAEKAERKARRIAWGWLGRVGN